jgi:hypothetical protein
MRRATCELVADTSKFDGPIDQAKAKLTSFGQAVSGIVSAVERTANVFNTLVSVADGIKSIKDAFDIVKSATTTAVNAMKNFPAIMEKVKSVASSAVGALRSVHPALLAIGAGGVVVAGTMYGIVKAFQGVVGISKSVAVSLRNVAVSMASISARAVSSIGTGLTNVFSGLGAIVGKVGIALGGLGISLGALDRFFKIGITSAIELGDAMKNLSARTGASIPFLFDMQKLFKNSGISADYAGNAMLNMQRALSGVNADGEPTNQMFERLGLSVENLMAMSPEDAFRTIGTTIANLGSESEKTAASFAIFGRQGGGLKAVFKDPAFAGLGTNFSQLGLSLAKNADNFSKISAKLRDSGSFFRGFFVEMAGAVAPSILELFKLFEGGGALQGFGKRLGEQIAFGVNVLVGAFKGGELLKLLQSTFQVAGVVMSDIFGNAMTAVSNTFVRILQSDIPSRIGGAFLDMFLNVSQSAVSLLWTAFQTPLSMLQAGMQTVFENALQFFTSKFPKIAELMGLGEFKAGTFAENLAGIKAGGGATFFGINPSEIGGDALKGVFDALKSSLSAGADASKILAEEMAKIPNLSEATRQSLQEYGDELKRLAQTGEPAKQAVQDITGTGTLGAPRARKEAEGRGLQDAVSSLQRIGGGGGAFRNDPLVRINEQQLAEQKKSNAIWQQILNASSPRDAMGAFYK